MEHAIALGQYFTSHATNLYRASDPTEENAQEALQRLTKLAQEKRQTTFSKTEVSTCLRPQFRKYGSGSGQEQRQALDELKYRNYLREQTRNQDGKGRPTVSYELRPESLKGA